MSWSRCQVPGEYLGVFRGILRGDCGDFVTFGVLTFLRGDDIMHAKITTPRDIYKHINAETWLDLIDYKLRGLRDIYCDIIYKVFHRLHLVFHIYCGKDQSLSYIKKRLF
jgi:hypothetical protein